MDLGFGMLTWRRHLAPEDDALWRRMQAGEISERAYWRERAHEVGALLGQDWTEMQDFVRAACGAEPEAMIRPEFFDAIDKADAAGIRLAILSNELDLFYGAGFLEKLRFFSGSRPWWTRPIQASSNPIHGLMLLFSAPCACLPQPVSLSTIN